MEWRVKFGEKTGHMILCDTIKGRRAEMTGTDTVGAGLYDIIVSRLMRHRTAKDSAKQLRNHYS
jgi:hypothetical protein